MIHQSRVVPLQCWISVLSKLCFRISLSSLSVFLMSLASLPFERSCCFQFFQYALKQQFSKIAYENNLKLIRKKTDSILSRVNEIAYSLAYMISTYVIVCKLNWLLSEQGNIGKLFSFYLHQCCRIAYCDSFIAAMSKGYIVQSFV